jgi:hypothetical protein
MNPRHPATPHGPQPSCLWRVRGSASTALSILMAACGGTPAPTALDAGDQHVASDDSGSLPGDGDGDDSEGGDGDGDPSGDGDGDDSVGGDGDTNVDGDGDGSSSERDAGTTVNLPKFSFFVTSLTAIRELAGTNGFGGDLRYGETGAGAGLRGADKICEKVAEMGLPGASGKEWHAFLSTTTVDARDRIGAGPWYDRLQRLVAMDIDDLLKTRPLGAHATIRDDLPNERGEPNHAGSADSSGNDNHDVITGSNSSGRHDGGSTCSDWTSTGSNLSGPRLGHSWPAMSGNGWIEAHPARGCAAAINLAQNGPGTGNGIGAGGGYGALYCFATTP